MAGETINIMRMAEKVSTEIFNKCGWKISGPANENFDCVQIEKHQKKSHPHHPVDAVFEYDDPYTNQRNYLLTDFKSYASGSIIASQVRKAIVELSKAVDCANSSEEWQNKYVNSEVNWIVHGMLFIYNHDGNFDRDFSRCLIETKVTSLHLPNYSKIFVFGPETISYLLNILNDIFVERGNGNLPISENVKFLYPDLINRRPTITVGDMARIELLLGPWQILPFENVIDGEINKGAYIYYRGEGKTPKEFEFLMDFAFKNQLVQPNSRISIRAPNADPLARQNFETAQDNILRNFYSFQEIKNRLDQFKFQPVTRVRENFSTEEIGMEARNG